VSNKLDLNLISLYRLKGQEWPTLPGLLAAIPPRRTARGRENDRLLVFLSIAGNVRLSSAEYAEITRQMADRYYGISGSITSALKATAEAVNAFLLERNVRLSGRGQYATGLLVMGALRDNQLYMVLSGPVHAFWMGPRGNRHFFDEQLSGRGLGTAQTTRLYYAQAEINAGDRLLFATHLPNNWVPLLKADRSASSLDSTRRRLMADAGVEVQAALISVQDGTGQMTILRATPTAVHPPETTTPKSQSVAHAQNSPQPATTPPTVTTPVPSQPVSKPIPSQPLASVPAQRPPMQRPPVQRPPTSRPVESTPHPITRSVPQPVQQQPNEAKIASRGLPFKLPSLRSSQESSPEPKMLVRSDAPNQLQPVFKWLAAGIRSVRQMQQRSNDGFKRFLPRLLPGVQDMPPQDDGIQSAPRSTTSMVMAFALPVIVITMAVVVYIQYGRTAQYQSFYSRAEQAAASTSAITDEVELRRAWDETIYWLEKAEGYESTAESRTLRRQAQASLDVLDRINRVNFQPALPTPFSDTIQIDRMVANETDVFLLNTERGEVYRVMLTQRGYEVDNNFICRSGVFGTGQVGPLIDVAALPRTNLYGAVAVGIDKNGTLLYCLPNGQSPQPVPLTAPDVGWRKIAAIGLDQGSLYVLDADANAVWAYYGNQSSFSEAPFFFFDEQIPRMDNVVDMAVNGDDIYLLRADGHLTTCTLSRISASPTRCVDPAYLSDTRAGRQGGATLPDAIFTQVVFAPPPHIALALFDANNRPVGEGAALPQVPISAMTFSPNQVLFVFVDGRLYYAADVP